MSEAAHTAFGAAVFIATLFAGCVAICRFWRKSRRAGFAIYLVQQARLDIEHGAEPMRTAREHVAKDRKARA